MLKFLQKPKATFDDFQSSSRYNLTRDLVIIYIIITGIFSILSYLINHPITWIAFIAFIICCGFYFLLKASKDNYRLVIHISCSSVSVLLSTYLFTVDYDTHHLEVVFYIIIILTAFYILGHRWGIFYLGVMASAYAIYFNFFYEDFMALQTTVDPSIVFFNTTGYIVAAAFFAFIMYHYGLANRKTAKMYDAAIAQLKEEKLTIEKSNKEKIILLQEIHHRVKNNLQVVISLLRMQSDGLEMEEAKTSFQEAIDRIITISLVHQKMYEGESLTEVDIKDYIDKLASDIIRTHVINQKIDYQSDIQLSPISIESLIPLGLIINELVSNSIKHAFQEEGKIKIKISSNEKDFFQFIYFDDGKWKNPKKEDTLGTKLIDIFTDQLDGGFERKITEEGTFYYFHFKLIEEH